MFKRLPLMLDDLVQVEQTIPNAIRLCTKFQSALTTLTVARPLANVHWFGAAR